MEASTQALCISFGSEDVFPDLAQFSVLGIIFETHRCAWGSLDSDIFSHIAFLRAYTAMNSPIYFVDFTYLQDSRLSDWHVALVELPHHLGFAFYTSPNDCNLAPRRKHERCINPPLTFFPSTLDVHPTDNGNSFLALW